jgi:hypothetical protein
VVQARASFTTVAQISGTARIPIPYCAECNKSSKKKKEAWPFSECFAALLAKIKEAELTDFRAQEHFATDKSTRPEMGRVS